MTYEEFDNLFDIYFNNITSNLAPGLNTYEKSVFLTKALDEIVKNYFTASSKGNNTGQGFDDSAKRLADFATLMSTASIEEEDVEANIVKIDSRSHQLKFPDDDLFIIINEVITLKDDATKSFQVIPLRYDEYVRLMSKPFKRPLKYQAWRLLNSGELSNGKYHRYAEIITTPEYDGKDLSYTIRYIRRPKPIIVGDLDDLKIDGKDYSDVVNIGCEVDPILHEDILQRAVELAKIAWTSTGNDNALLVMTAGQRSE